MDERYELYHAGIKGMKWGIRRYQNKDGSLTPLGRIRYGVGKAGEKIGNAAKAAGERHKANVASKKEEKRVEALMKKPIRKLTEAELKERTDRINKEKQLREAEKQNRQSAADAEAFVKRFGNKMLNDALIPGLVSAGKNVITKFTEKALTKALGIDAPDMTNTYDLFKKAGFDTTKLTDAQINALEKRRKAENTIYQQGKQIDKGRKDDDDSNPSSDPKPKDKKGQKEQQSEDKSSQKNDTDSQSTRKDKSTIEKEIRDIKERIVETKHDQSVSEMSRKDVPIMDVVEKSSSSSVTDLTTEYKRFGEGLVKRLSSKPLDELIIEMPDS